MKLTFEEWKRKVDTVIAVLFGGLDSECLPDYDYRGAYERGIGPATTARDAVRAAKKI